MRVMAGSDDRLCRQEINRQRRVITTAGNVENVENTWISITTYILSVNRAAAR